jgi:hypothetical protein
VIGDVLCVFSRSLSLLLLRASAKLALPVWSCDAFGMLWPGRISRADKPKVFPSLHSKLGPDSQKRIVGQWDFERLGCRWDWHTQSSIHTLFFSFIFFFFSFPVISASFFRMRTFLFFRTRDWAVHPPLFLSCVFLFLQIQPHSLLLWPWL